MTGDRGHMPNYQSWTYLALNVVLFPWLFLVVVIVVQTAIPSNSDD